MIYIKQDKTDKLPGKYSLFISFNYSREIVDALKSTQLALYNDKTKEWECPITSLAKLIDLFYQYDDINLELAEDEKEQAIDYSQITLSPTKTTPYKYQQDGIKYGLAHDRYLLLDAAGLGKSLQMIYLAQELKQREGIEHCLIICGINSLKTNWKREVSIHSDLTAHILGERINRKGKTVFGGIPDRVADLKQKIDDFFIITNVETLRNPDVVKLLNSDKYNKIDMIVFDEVHKANNPQAQQSKGLLKLTKAKHKIGLSGTILTNSPLNAYVPLKWIGAEHCNFTNFRYFYCSYSGPFNNILVGYKNLNILKDQINEYSLRRTKDILELPEKHIIHEYLDMEGEQSVFYDNIVNGVTEQVDKVELNTTNLLALTSRLRQAVACPSMLTTDDVPSVKIERACELADSILEGTDEKLVIFSVFKETLSVLQKRLEKYNPLLCTGDINDIIITENINKFQEDSEYRVILCTTAKMGTGITLTRASYCIFIDSPWTASDASQCEDRIYRIGTSKSVFIYYLWAMNTIDTRVKEIVDDKSMMSDYVIDDKVNKGLINRLRELIIDLKGA